MSHTGSKAASQALRPWLEMEVGARLPAPLLQRFLGAGVDPAGEIRRAAAAGEGEQAAAALIATLLQAWERGRALDRTGEWTAIGEDLLTSAACSGAAAGALAVHLMVAGLLGPADLPALLCSLPRLHELVARAESVPLYLLAAAAEAHLHLLRGDVELALTVIRDASYLVQGESAASLPAAYLGGGVLLARALGGDPGPKALALLDALGGEDMDSLPLHLRLTLEAHRLFDLARRGDAPSAERAADALRALVIPAQRSYHRSYMHYALGVAELTSGRPHASVMHARLAIEEGVRSGSTPARLVPALLLAQGLLDQGLGGEGLAVLDRYEPEWRRHGFGLHLISAGLERAAWWERAGRVDQAKAARDFARQVFPGRPWSVALHRSGTPKPTLASLSRPSAAVVWPQGREIEIVTLGRFELQVAGRPLPVRGWGGGRRASLLLRTLIALGGRQVRQERLCDLLWPDSDGDQARQNLKVALWRLRRVGARGPQARLPWLQVHQGAVSIDPQLCGVDALRFQEALARSDGEPETLWGALEGYGGDFLPGDEWPVVMAFRDRLRQDYLAGLWSAAQASVQSRAAVRPDRVALVRDAVRTEPDYLHGYELLMSLYLKCGQTTEAMLTFHLAEQHLPDLHQRPAARELLWLRRQAAERVAGSDRWGERGGLS